VQIVAAMQGVSRAIEALAWRSIEFPTFSPPLGQRRLPADIGFNRIKFADPAQGLCHRP
jgi:hypothetical protein